MLKYRQEIETTARRLTERNTVLKRLPMKELIDRHGYMDRLIDRLIEEQQALRSLFEAGYATEGPMPEDHLLDSRLGAASEQDPPHDLPIGMAEDTWPQGIAQRRREILSEIEELETEVRIYRYQITTLEEVIRETQPIDAVESVRKLRFLSQLMRDGADFAPEDLADLIEECAGIVAPEEEGPAGGGSGSVIAGGFGGARVPEPVSGVAAEPSRPLRPH